MALERPANAFALSGAQSALWFAQQLSPALPMTIALYLDLHGPIDTARLSACAVQAGMELGSGSICFGETHGQPYQFIDPGLDRTLRVLDMQPEPDPYGAAVTWMTADHQAPLDVMGAGVTRSVLLRLGPDHHLLYLRAHHLAVDGVGAVTLLQRAAALYNGPAAKKPVSLPDAVAAEQRYLGSRRFAADAEYWAAQLAGIHAITSLSVRHSAPSIYPHRVEAILDSATMNALAEAGQRHQASLAELLVAVCARYLAQMTGDSEVTIALPVAARTTAVLRNAAGVFTNTLPLRMSGTAATGDLIASARRTTVAALRHQLFRHERMRAATGFGARGIFGPLLNMVLATPPVQIGAAAGRVRLVTAGPVEDLMINFYREDAEQPLTVSMHANPNSYQPGDVARYHRGLISALADFARSPAASRRPPPRGGRSLSPRGVHQHTLAALFAAAGASVAPVGANPGLTFAELRAQSAQLARELIAHGAGPERFVAVMMSRSWQSVLAAHAVAKTGAALVPLDPAQPAPRLRAMLSQVNVAVGITLSAERGTLSDSIDWLLLDAARTQSSVQRRCAEPLTDADRRQRLRPDNIAYVIFTSGSTGAPKGVAVTHAGLRTLAGRISADFAVDADSVVLHSHSPSFDASLLELLCAPAGAQLVPAPPGATAGAALAQILRIHEVTHFLTTPAVLATLDPHSLPALRTVVVGGEPCPETLANTWGGQVRLFNSYGLTETTVVVSQSGPLLPGAPVPIGRPLPNVVALVLDSRLCPAPNRGELYVAGPLLARGYLGRPGETATRFVAAPGGHGERCYRTGDIVQHHADGQLLYATRSDDQLTLHGYRIEPAEVESVLQDCRSVRRAVVTVHAGARGPQLVAHVIPRDAATFNAPAVQDELRLRLPSAMVPANIIALEELPLTANGKIDRAALPAPVLAAPYRAPATPHEEIVAKVLGAALQHSPVGRDDEFFQLGGNSLLAAGVAAELASATGAPVTVQWIFAHATVSGLAQEISRSLTAPGSGTKSALDVSLWLRRTGGVAPLFCIHSAVPLSWCYAGLVQYLPGRPVCGLQSPAILNSGGSWRTIDDLVTAYASEIRAARPAGPYHLLGWSFGGQLAHALAIELRTETTQVTLTMLDSLVFPPKAPDPPLPTMRDLLAHFTDPVAVADLPEDISAADGADWLGKSVSGSGRGLTAAQLDRIYDGYVMNTLLSHEYRPAVFSGDLLYFCATTGMTELADSSLWQPYVRGLITEYPVATDHASLTTPAALAAIGPRLARYLSGYDPLQSLAAVDPR